MVFGVVVVIDVDVIYICIEALAVDFTDTFGAAHDVGWIDGFVGGYHDEFLGAVLDGEVGDDMGALYVVANGFDWVVFHHRHVFVGCCMEYIVGTVVGEDVVHVVAVGDGGYDGLDFDYWVFALHPEA